MGRNDFRAYILVVWLLSGESQTLGSMSFTARLLLGFVRSLRSSSFDSLVRQWLDYFYSNRDSMLFDIPSFPWSSAGEAYDYYASTF